MQSGDIAEEQAVPSHRVIDTGSRQDQTVGATEGGKHDSHRHQRASRRAEHLGHHCGPHAILSGVLDATLQDGCAIGAAVQRQGGQVDQVAENIKQDHDPGAYSERQGEIAAGVLDLASREGHVVPGISGKQRPHLRNRENGQAADQHCRPSHTHLDGVFCAEPGVLPEVSAEISC